VKDEIGLYLGRKKKKKNLKEPLSLLVLKIRVPHNGDRLLCETSEDTKQKGGGTREKGFTLWLAEFDQPTRKSSYPLKNVEKKGRDVAKLPSRRRTEWNRGGRGVRGGEEKSRGSIS